MVVSDTGRLPPAGVGASSPTSLLPHRPQRAGLGRLLWPRHGLFGHVNAKNNRQNGHETPLAWPKRPRVGVGTARGGLEPSTADRCPKTWRRWARGIGPLGLSSVWPKWV